MNRQNNKREENGSFGKPEMSAEYIVPPLCRSCGEDLTVVDKKSEELLDDGNVVETMATILSSAEHDNVIITGEAGTGKTALVKLLGRCVAEGSVPALKDKKIHSINLDLLFNDCHTRSEQGTKLRNLCLEAEENGIILFIDEAHRIYEAGDNNSLGNIMKPYVTKGAIQVILATTTNECDESIGKDGALTRRFKRIRLTEPDTERTRKIVRTVSSVRYPKLTISDGVISEMVDLADRYTREESYNPDKTLAVLDHAVGWLRNHSKGSEITDEVLKQSMSLVLGIPRERFEQDMTACIRALKGNLATQFPMWKKQVSALSEKLSCALIRANLQKGPLCSAAIAGSDMGLLRDVAYSAAEGMGFDKTEITPVSPSDGAEKLLEPFLLNPNRAVIVEIGKDIICGGSKILDVLTMILAEGRIRGKGIDVLYDKTPVLVLFEGEEKKSGNMGFITNDAYDAGDKTAEEIRLTDNQENLRKLWFGGERPFCFGGIGREDAAVLYESRFLPLLDEQITKAAVPLKITIEDSAKEYITERLASSGGWSAASEIILDLIRRAILDGAEEHIAVCSGDVITLRRAANGRDGDIRETRYDEPCI